MRTVTQLEVALQNIFGQADRRARDTGFVQRGHAGKVNGKSFVATQALGLQVPGGGSLSDLAYFATHVGTHITPQGRDQRFTEKAAAFLQAVLNVAFTQVVAADPVAIPFLQRFSEVIGEDSSTFSLPDALREEWKGCGGTTAGTLSAFKIQVRDAPAHQHPSRAVEDPPSPDPLTLALAN